AVDAYREPLGDYIEDPTHEFLWLKLASTPLGDASFADWAASVFAGHGCTGYLDVEIDGFAGKVNGTCSTALVASGGRGYFIGAHFCPCELGSVAAWNRWFSVVLTTVRLEPDNAIDRR